MPVSIEEKRRKHNERVARWAAKNPEKAKEVRRRAVEKYNAANAEKVAAQRREYRAKNKELRARAWGEWYDANKEKVRAKDRERRHGSPELKLKYLLQSAKGRAKKKGITFDVTVDDVSTPTHCPLLGVKLIYTGSKMHTENSASIDRIDSNLGYVKGNVWVVSRRANVIKNDATVDELLMIAYNLEKKIRDRDDE